MHRERENESSRVRTRSWFVMQGSDDAAGDRSRAPNKPPPCRGIRLRKTRRCVWRATVNSRRGSLSARNALTSKSIINPSIGPGRRIPSIPSVYIYANVHAIDFNNYNTIVEYITIIFISVCYLTYIIIKCNTSIVFGKCIEYVDLQ